jgi:BirA family biotin operon repressor/biotin-[acetyl-CoA-carboxylase] ligase
VLTAVDSWQENLLSELRRSATPLSGEAIGRSLGVSRAALWKRIETLRALGYSIEGAAGSGYRLTGSPDVPHPWEVRNGLDTKTKRLGRSVRHFERCVSTQDDLRAAAEAGAPEGALFIAEELEAARGRMGRSFFTPRGGLWFSLLLRPERPPQEVALLSLAVAVALHQAIEHVTALRPLVRWPNDLLIDGKKIAGILVEMASEQDVVRYVIPGIGVNVNVRAGDFPADLRPIATSLSEALGRDVPRVALLQRFLERMELLYDEYLGAGATPVLDAWRGLPTILGQRIVVEERTHAWEGTAEDIDAEGALLVRDGGETRRVIAGDVRIIT